MVWGERMLTSLLCSAGDDWELVSERVMRELGIDRIRPEVMIQVTRWGL